MTPQHRLTARHGALLIVDMQVKLLGAMSNPRLVEVNATRLAQAARELELPVFATEQYPAGLGPTVPSLVDLVPRPPAKLAFSCCAVPELIEGLNGRGVRHVTLAGLETHVCILQTALDLINLGFAVAVPADAVASRHPFDWEFALRRLERAGAIVTTTEAILFEWVESADSPCFPTIRSLVKNFDPSAPTLASKGE